jgi:predicted ArsR family transcriptional regulator
LGDDLDEQLDQLAALGDPVRRALYRFVVAQPEPVTRGDAAKGVGVAQHTAKFHLDRLVDDRLLQAAYRRPPGRGGPGAGRPAKVYRRSDAAIEVSLPARRYDLAGRLLVRAAAGAQRTASTVDDALRKAARDEGNTMGAESRSRRRGRASMLDALFEALREAGYEPVQEGPEVVLRNCPFDELAREDPGLVCGMNLAYLEGVIDGAGAPARAELHPVEGRCCVRMLPT